MKTYLSAFALIASVMTAPAVFAAERTVTFAVDNMTCASCPYIVKTSMAAVPGVATVAVSFEAKTATVTFDDAKTNPNAIAAASMNAGYPARRCSSKAADMNDRALTSPAPRVPLSRSAARRRSLRWFCRWLA